jgi:hypothetical protein
MLAIDLKLLLPVTEDKEGGINQAVPGNNPVSMGFDNFCWCRWTMEELEVLTKFNNVIVVVQHSVDIGKNMVEVDSIAAKEVEPLGLRKLG